MLNLILALLQKPYRLILFVIWDNPQDADSIKKQTAIPSSHFYDDMAYLVQNELIIYDSDNETFIANQELKRQYIRFMRRNFFTITFFLVRQIIAYSNRRAQKSRNSRFENFNNR